MGQKSRLRRSISQWANPVRDEAHQLQRETEKAGLTLIADAPDREPVKVQGTIRTITLRPRGGVPVLEAELYDGSGSITLLWLGRRRLAGVIPGRMLTVAGRIGNHDGARVLYNPRYELKP